MSEAVEIFSSMKDHKKRLRATYGVSCPMCKVKRPKAQPTILLPQQQCKVDGYKDARPELTNKQYSEI